MTVPDELRRLYARGRVVPFVGAGISMAVNWDEGGERRRGISWGELVDFAARELQFDPDLIRMRGSDLQIIEYVIAKKGGSGFLGTWLARMNPPDVALTA